MSGEKENSNWLFYSLFPVPYQLRKPRFGFLTQAEPHAHVSLNLSSSIEQQQGRQVLNAVAPPEFLSCRAAEVYVEKLDTLSPRSLQPMHDGPRRLAAQSEIRVEVQEADPPGTQPGFEIAGRAKRSVLLPPPNGDSPHHGDHGNQRGPRRPGRCQAAQNPGDHDKSNAGSDEQRVPRDESGNGVNGFSL